MTVKCIVAGAVEGVRDWQSDEGSRGQVVVLGNHELRQEGRDPVSVYIMTEFARGKIFTVGMVVQVRLGIV